MGSGLGQNMSEYFEERYGVAGARRASEAWGPVARPPLSSGRQAGEDFAGEQLQTARRLVVGHEA